MAYLLIYLIRRLAATADVNKQETTGNSGAFLD